MKARVFVDRLLRGDIYGVLKGHEEVLIDFLRRAVLPNKDFLLCLELACGCQRHVHFTIDNVYLVTKPDKRLTHVLDVTGEFSWPTEERGCAQPVIPERWANLPILGLRIGYSHRKIDDVFRYRQAGSALPA